ncbi:hypothetical protein KKF29_00445, partial [Patescibacteria group bacterium]|nr:hypothetical protein [Patescibacteria group bacterium]
IAVNNKQIKEVIDDSIAVNNKQIKEVIDDSIAVNNKQIKEVIDDSIASNNDVLKKDLRLEFGEIIENQINPQFEAIDNRFEDMDKRFDRLEKRMDTHENRTVRDRGDLTVCVKKGDKKINKLSKLLHRKKILSDSELKQLENYKVYTG